MKNLFIGLGVISILLSFVVSCTIDTETAFQQLVRQNYITHGLLFSLFFLVLALLFSQPNNKEKQ